MLLAGFMRHSKFKGNRTFIELNREKTAFEKLQEKRPSKTDKKIIILIQAFLYRFLNQKLGNLFGKSFYCLKKAWTK